MSRKRLGRFLIEVPKDAAGLRSSSNKMAIPAWLEHATYCLEGINHNNLAAIEWVLPSEAVQLTRCLYSQSRVRLGRIWDAGAFYE